MKRLRTVFAMVFTTSLALAATVNPPITSRACPGGGGGITPLLDMSHLFPQSFQQVPTSTSVEEFVFMEKRNVLIYRDSNNALAARDFNASVTAPLDYQVPAISRLLDKDERYVLIDKDTKFLDLGLGTPYWHSFSTKYPVYKHLFWAKESGDDVLYTWSSLQREATEQQTLILYRYGTHDKTPTSCKLAVMSGEKFFAGEGHTYPDAFIYKTRPTADKKGTEVALYNLRVGNPAGGVLQPHQCTPIPATNRVITVPGNVTGVYQLPDQNGAMKYPSYAIKTDDPVHNLLWIYRTDIFTPYRCHSYDFAGRKPFVLNPKRSVIATWAEGEGITLVYPQRKEQAKIFPGLRAHDLKETDFWLADSGKKLFVATKATAADTKKIYALDLPR